MTMDLTIKNGGHKKSKSERKKHTRLDVESVRNWNLKCDFSKYATTDFDFSPTEAASPQTTLILIQIQPPDRIICT